MVWNIAHSGNPHFTEKDDLLDQPHQQFIPIGTPGDNSSPRLAWFFTCFFLLVVGTQIFLGFVYNTGSTPPALIFFNGLITLITFTLAVFQIFPGGIQIFFGSLHVPGLTTFLLRRAPLIHFFADELFGEYIQQARSICTRPI